jgi:hypothetical protein
MDWKKIIILIIITSFYAVINLLFYKMFGFEIAVLISLSLLTSYNVVDFKRIKKDNDSK